MYAIVKTGGKQYRVEQGQTLLVERLPQAEGETVMLEPLLVRSEEAVFDAEGLAEARGLRRRSSATCAARSCASSSSSRSAATAGAPATARS